MKDFAIFIVGGIILSPIVIFGLSDNVFGFLIALVWLVGVICSTKFFPKFWQEWWDINMFYSNFFENKK